MRTFYIFSDVVSEDILLLESDIVYEKRAIKEVIQDNNKNILLVSGKTNSKDEVWVEVDDKKNLVNLSKKVENLNSAYGEMVGISKLSRDTLKKIWGFAEKEFSLNPKIDYEYVIKGISRDIPVFVKKIDDLLWGEIDDINHLKRVSEKIYPLL